MASNKALIAGAGIAAPRFTDAGLAFKTGGRDSKYADQLRLLKYKEKRAREYQDETEMQNFVLGMEFIDVSKIEESMQPEVADYLMTQKKIYGDAARIASKNQADDPKYMAAVDTMNRINGAFKNLSSTLNSFKTFRETYYKDREDGDISDQWDGTVQKANLNSLLKNNIFDIEIDDYGNVDLAHNNKMVSLKDFNKNPDYQYSLKNNIGFKDIMELTSKAQSLGSKLTGGLKENYSYALSNILDNMDRHDLLSMIYDKTITGGKPPMVSKITNEMLLQPGINPVTGKPFEDELRKWIFDEYFAGISHVADQGYTQARNNWKEDLQAGYEKALAKAVNKSKGNVRYTQQGGKDVMIVTDASDNEIWYTKNEAGGYDPVVVGQ